MDGYDSLPDLAFCFSIGMGPGAWLIPSEVFSTLIRAKAMSLAAFSSRVYATVMASTFLSLANLMGYSGFFMLLSIICFLLLGFFWVYLPETKGRSLEDMSLYFAQITGDRTVLEAEQELSQLPVSKGAMGRGTTAATEFEGDEDNDGERASNANPEQSSGTLRPVV